MYDFYSSSWSSILFVSSGAALMQSFVWLQLVLCNRLQLPNHIKKTTVTTKWAIKSAPCRSFVGKYFHIPLLVSTHRRAHHITFIFSQVLASKSIWLLRKSVICTYSAGFRNHTTAMRSRYQSLTVFFRAYSSEVFAQWIWSRAKQWTSVHDANDVNNTQNPRFWIQSVLARGKRYWDLRLSLAWL